MENEGRIIDERHSASAEGANSVFRAMYARVQVRVKAARRLERPSARNAVHAGVLLAIVLMQADVVLEHPVTRATVRMLILVMTL